MQMFDDRFAVITRFDRLIGMIVVIERMVCFTVSVIQFSQHMTVCLPSRESGHQDAEYSAQPQHPHERMPG